MLRLIFHSHISNLIAHDVDDDLTNSSSQLSSNHREDKLCGNTEQEKKIY